MSVRKIRNSWWVDFRHAGERHRRRSPLNSRHGAEDYELTLRSRLNRGEPIDGTVNEQKTVPTFAEFAPEWFETYVKANNKPSEVNKKAMILRVHLVPAFGPSPLDQIVVHQLEAYKRRKLASGLAAKTVNNHIAVLAKALVCAMEWGLVIMAPKTRPLKVPPSRIDFLSDEECRRLLGDDSEPHWHLMVLMALRTGLRLGELLALEWADIDFARRRLTVVHSVIRGVVTSPKSNRIRYIPLTTDLLQALGSVSHRTRLVFEGRGGAHLTDSMAQRALSRMYRRAGVRHVHWHLFRHTFASQLVSRGTPLRKVQILLGHSTIQMTERYAHLAPSDLDDAVDVLEPAFQTRHSQFGQQVGNTAVKTRLDLHETPVNTA